MNWTIDKRQLAAVLVMLVAVAMTGCAALERVEESPVASHLVANQITLRFIARADDPVARAADVRDVLQRVRKGIDQREQEGRYTLTELVSVVRGEISWGSLSLADQQLLEDSLAMAESALSDLIGEGVLDANERETVATLFTWIDNAAARVR